MPAKAADVDPAAIKGWIADARKKPISFALLAGGGGLIMQADKVKSPDQMRKTAKSMGGTKGCWGKMEVKQKTLVLTYEGNPPGGFEKQVRKLLTDAGAGMRVEMLSLGEVEAEADAAEKAAEEEERAKAEAAAAKRKPAQEDAPEPAKAAPDGASRTAAEPDLEEADDEADAEDDEEVSDLPTVLKLARKKPLNFACLLADDGVVLVTHRRKNWGILVKQAKGQGASAKGAWGTLSVEAKQVILNCIEDPPGTLGRRLKNKLRAEGQKYTVVIRSPAGEAVDQADDDDAEDQAATGRAAQTAGGPDAAAPSQGDAGPAPTQKRGAAATVPIETQLEEAAAAIDQVRGGLSAKQSKMFGKLMETAEAQSAADPSKASGTLKLLLQKLDALGLQPAPASATADDGGRAEKRKSRLKDIAALRSRADAVMARIRARQA